MSFFDRSNGALLGGGAGCHRSFAAADGLGHRQMAARRRRGGAAGGDGREKNRLFQKDFEKIQEEIIWLSVLADMARPARLC